MNAPTSTIARDAIARSIEAMNACIGAAEQEFARLNLCVAATAIFPPDPHGPRWLRFGKVGTGWILQVQTEDQTTEPLRNCDIKTRRAALALLPQLHAALIAASLDTARSIDLAVHDATAFLETLRKQP